jgi:hypothetical protein
LEEVTGIAPKVISPADVVGVIGIVREVRSGRDRLVSDLSDDLDVAAKESAAAMGRGTLGNKGVVELDDNRANYSVRWDIFVGVVDIEGDGLV